jgi:hypothetical protein
MAPAETSPFVFLSHSGAKNEQGRKLKGPTGSNLRAEDPIECPAFF